MVSANGNAGTTETQRAVSFYEIPSRKEDPNYLDSMGDVIPAGKGMKDVSALLKIQSFQYSNSIT